jgi:myo-inositol 2-dehydrogenase/D-chiro-inositol 1-dehydrogenase
VPTWLDACRSVELAETIARSLKRGRTIELHYEDFSEQSTFKGMMTSLGCGLLVAALFIMLLAAVGGRLGLPFARHWVTLLLLLLGSFLALQALRLVFPRQD